MEESLNYFANRSFDPKIATDDELKERLKYIAEQKEFANSLNGEINPVLLGVLDLDIAEINTELGRRHGTNGKMTEAKLELSSKALYGLAGEIVLAIDPYTEADPVAILTNTLVAFGNVVGPSPH